ncbi:MAG: hypothetical protein ACFFB3_18895 [Candidatus Hodarchaeota archaeon]
MGDPSGQEPGAEEVEMGQTGRVRCPKCNGLKLRKVEDRSRPLASQYGVFEGVQTFKKVWKCGECGEIFE